MFPKYFFYLSTFSIFLILSITGISNYSPVTLATIDQNKVFPNQNNLLRFISLDGSNSDSSLSFNSTSISTSIPESAKGPTVPDKGYWMEDLGGDLYAVSDGTYNTMFLITENGVIAIDAPPSIGEKYLLAIKEVTDKPVSHVIYSHAHLDHIGAAGMFPKNATIISHEQTANELIRATEVALNTSMIPPIPDVIFSNNMTLALGNKSLDLKYYGTNHSPGNIFIYSPSQKVLMVVDIIFPGWIPFPYLAMAKDTAGFIEAHEIILNKYDLNTIIAGHLTRLGTVDDVKIQKAFIDDLKQAASNANTQVKFGDVAQRVGSFDNPWLLFSQYIEEVDNHCINELLPKWQDKLGGAQQFIDTHCFTMTEDERINPTVMALLQNSTLENE